METWTALILGLVGSLHCAGMCGPLVLALPQTGKTGSGYFFGRLGYNCGRVITYCLMGVVFGLLGQSLVLAGIQRWVSIGLGTLLLTGLLVSRRLALWGPVITLVNKIKHRMAGLLRQNTFVALLVLGILNGFLPCGLVYVACGGATMTGGMLGGLCYMAAFGAGTVPLMLAISLSGRLMPMPLRLKLLKAVPVAVFLVGSLLILRGMGLGIPYVSPDLATVGGCCHH